MTKTLIYYAPEYRELAQKIRQNYIAHRDGECDLISKKVRDDVAYAREKKYDEAIFIENDNTVIIHYVKSGYTLECPVADACYS